ncbi:MoaD/ThiS family protein [Methanocella sp. MCL-LM]|uniref:MoaD/ThiS family protein n=1 Tax=Methanocella sp. MCL-LM TaxID=3412035 RepID=UPI003C716817
MKLQGQRSQPVVKVVIVGYASDVLDHRSLELPLWPRMTMKDLFAELSRFGRQGFREAIYNPDTGRMNEYLAVFVNSREIRSLNGLDTPLSEGDTVTIMPPMAGGSAGG